MARERKSTDSISTADQDLLKELRDKFNFGDSEWKEIRAEGTKDMQYLSGNPWSKKDKEKREKAGRQCLALDELGQYVNQVVNDWRQNKRGIKVSPARAGATDKTASFRQGKIRDIEYRSNAQQAYTAMGENMLTRSYGFMRIDHKFVSDRSFDQELYLEPVVNPDLVTPDPDHQRPDGQDLNWLFYHEDHTVDDFKRQWPKAKVTSFGPEQRRIAHGWFQGEKIRVAEAWIKQPGPKRHLMKIQLLKQAPVDVFEDELDQYDIKRAQLTPKMVLQERDVPTFKVMQYLTNGVEILERNPWPGQSIPWVTCYGKILYIENKKSIMSITRLARDPYMFYCYIRSCQAEAIGGVPRNSWVAYEGQIVNPKDWQKANHEPVAFLEAKATVEGAPHDEVLPLPARQAWDPPLHNLELVAEAARRAIQAAMGGSPLPTAAQRRNEKSGKALEQIESSAQKGSFHFTDHYDDSVTRGGAILDECLAHYYDNSRQTSIRKPDDSVDMVHINTPEQPGSVQVDEGEHDVTISVGPYAESERAAASDFASEIVANGEIVQVIGPQKAAKLIALAIRLKNVGATGDAMAEVIDPKQNQNDPAQAAQMAQQLQGENQALKGQLQQAAQIIETKKVEADTKVKQSQIASVTQVQLQTMKDATQIAVAKIAALTKGVVSDNEAQVEAIALAHEADQNAFNRQHDVNLARLGHQQALEQGQQATLGDAARAEQDQGHALEQGDQAHAQALEAGDQGHMQAMEQATQAAALAPKPEAGA